MMKDDGDHQAPPSMPSLDDGDDGERGGLGVAMEEGGGGGQIADQDLDFIRNRDLLAVRLRRKRFVIGGIVALLVAALLLAVVLGIAGGNNDDDDGQQKKQQQQQQQQQQQGTTTEGHVQINDDVISLPLSSSSMEDIYVPVLDNDLFEIYIPNKDSATVLDGGGSAALLVTNITGQPSRGGECMISLDMTQVVYSPPRATTEGGEYDVGYVDECGYEACLMVQDNGEPSECGVAVVTINVQNVEEEVEGDDAAVEDGPAMPASTKAFQLPEVSYEGDVLDKDAVVAIHGDTAVLGEHHVESFSGVVLVYVRDATSGEWNQQARLTLPDEDGENSYFGWSLGIHENTIVVGAWGTGYNKGSAHVFVRDDEADTETDAWSHQATLEAPDGTTGNHFGYDVAIFGDVVVVSAFWDDESGPASKSVYVFVRDGATWSYQDRLSAPDGEENDWFGNSVNIYENTIVVGAWWDDDESSDGIDSGSAHVFVKDGDAWSHQAKLMDNVDGRAEDRFGNRVAIYADTIVVGARGDDHDVDIDGKVDIGSAYVFVRYGDVWTQQAKLVSPNSAPGDQFGNNVAIYGDTIVVGARWDDDSEIDSGSVHVFVRDGEAWTHRARLVALGGGEAEEYFGFTIGIDDGTIVIGSANGNAYVYSDYLGR